MKHLLFAAFLVALPITANCPDGSHFEGDGSFYCQTLDDGTFVCSTGGTCVMDCPPVCVDVVASATTSVKKLRNGKTRVTRWVVHTELPMNPARPHLWIVKDPDTGKTAVVPVPIKQTLGPKLAALMTHHESALREEFPAK